jgi:hypothetical protein
MQRDNRSVATSICHRYIFLGPRIPDWFAHHVLRAEAQAESSPFSHGGFDEADRNQAGNIVHFLIIALDIETIQQNRGSRNETFRGIYLMACCAATHRVHIYAHILDRDAAMLQP